MPRLRSPCPASDPVLTAADLPQPVPRFGPQFTDRPVIAVGETKYHGDPVAAVAAESRDAAEEAAELVKVDYEELPAVFTVAGALAPDAPLVQDPSLRPGDPLANTNVLREHRIGWGEVDGATADLIVENTYTFPMVTHFAIEPHAFIAAPDGDGLAIWTSIQHPYWLQRVMAKVVGMPLSKVRIHAPDPGGAFGGKQHAKYEPLRRVHGARHRPTVPARPHARGDVPGCPPDGDGDPRPNGRQPRRHLRLPGHRRQLPDRRLRRHRRPRRGQGQLHRQRAVQLAGRAHRCPLRPVAHRAVDGLPRFRQPTDQLGGRVEHLGSGAPARVSTRSISACATSPTAATSSSRSTRRPTASGRTRCAAPPS